MVQYLDTVADVMEAFIELFLSELKNERYNETFICAMTWCFQPNEILHKNFFQMTDDELKRLATSRQTWRTELKVGDRVDVQVVADDKQKVTGWLQATIVADEDDILSLEFSESSAEFDTQKDRWSTDLAKVGTRTGEDYEWRKTTLEGEDVKDLVIDCHDKYNWEEATIFSTARKVEMGREVTMAFIGFRVYRSYGKKMRSDERGLFDGWSSKFDEWIPIYSPRIQPHLSKVGNAGDAEE